MAKRRHQPFILKHRRISSLLLAGVMNISVFFLYFIFVPPVPPDSNVLGVTKSMASVGITVDTPRLGFAVVGAYTERIITTLNGITKFVIYPDTEFDLDPRYVFVNQGKVITSDIEVSNPNPLDALFRDYDDLDIGGLAVAKNSYVKTVKLTEPKYTAWVAQLKEASSNFHTIKFGKINGLRDSSSEVELNTEKGRGTFTAYKGNLLLFDDDMTFLLKVPKNFSSTFSFTSLVSGPQKIRMDPFRIWSTGKTIMITGLGRFILSMIMLYALSVALSDYLIERYAFVYRRNKAQHT